MYLKLFFTTLPIFITLDLLWLGVVAKSFYRNQIGYLMTDNVNWGAVAIFYIVFTVGMIIFVINPALVKGSISHVLTYGLLFGLVTYATYDLVNLSVVKDWPVLVTIVDIAWGGFIVATTTTLVYLIANKFGF